MLRRFEDHFGRILGYSLQYLLILVEKWWTLEKSHQRLGLCCFHLQPWQTDKNYSQLENLGNTCFQKENKFTTLLGAGQVAPSVEVKEDNVIVECKFCPPSYEEFINAKDSKELLELVPPCQNVSPNFSGLSAFLPAPFLCNAILEANLQDPFYCINIAFQAATEFETDHKDDIK